MVKVLLMDDDEALRRLIHLELGNDYEIIDSGQPEEALALALKHRPDAILLDLQMPKYSGFELLQTFTSLSHTQMIPVIVVSDEAGGQTRERCKQLGAAGYFEKPIDFEALRTAIRQIPRRRSHTARGEVRVRLCIPVKLRGVDGQGKNFEEVATTENVSLAGFLFSSTADLAMNSIVDVYMTSHGEDYVGKAKIVQAASQRSAVRHYGCRFIGKTGPWVLQ